MVSTESGTGGTSASMAGGPYRVMVVDDSAVVRGLLSRALESDPSIEVVTSVSNGEIAVNSFKRHPVEIVILDIEMPVMDGLTALPLLLKEDPNLRVIMASTLTLRNADISLRALELGASDYIPKPSSTSELSAGYDFKTELIGKVKVLGAARRGASGAAPMPTQKGREEKKATSRPKLYAESEVTLRKIPSGFSPEIVAIGSSTGGPQALFKLFGDIKDISLPILITQHMPATFTKILAEHISRIIDRECVEGFDGAPVVPGKVYIAPGDFHMTVAIESGSKVIRLDQNPPVNFCRPAVDPMFDSIAKAYGHRILAVVLTGMGQDGAVGAKTIAEGGGAVVAQDEATSVVWGMPGATAVSGACCAVLPIDKIGESVRQMVLRNAA